jgi:DNA polymerase-3 subunit epsilon
MSKPWHLGMLAAFDTETTSADPETARVVTAHIAYVDGSGAMAPELHDWLIDPGIEIPAKATEIHGITTEHARENGEQAGPALFEISYELTRCGPAGVPVVIYNAPYDLTVMDRETRRHGLDPFGDEWDSAKGTAIDPLVLDKALDRYRKGSRTLSATCAHYGVRLDKAHAASADAIAAARVAWMIAARYPHIAAMSLTELHAFQVAEKRKQAQSFQELKRKQGSSEVIDGSWPMTPWSGERVA